MTVTAVNQISLLFWLDNDGFVTVSGRLSREALARSGGNFDHKSVMDALFDLEGGDIAYEYEVLAIRMVDQINALSREQAREVYANLDFDTVLHLRPLGLCASVGEMEAKGLCDPHPRAVDRRAVA